MNIRQRIRGSKGLAAIVCLSALAFAADAGFGQELKPAERTAKLLAEQPRGDFAKRRRVLMEQIKAAEGDETPAIVVLRGEGPAGDSKYKQGNAFVYLTGVEIPNASLILLPKEGRETLYLPPRPNMPNTFRAETGETFGPGPEAEQALGFEHVESTANFLGDFFHAAADPIAGRGFGRRRAGGGNSAAPVVYTLEPESRPSMRFGQGEAQESRDAKFSRFLREGAPTTTYKDVAPLLNELRKNKYDGEVSLLRKAIAITGNAQKDVIKTIRPGLFEYELEGKVIGAFIAGGAERVGFDSIIGSGVNSTFPHYFANRRMMEDGDVVVVDIGAEYRYYTADVTRTYPVNGKFSPRQREIYQLVLDCQSECAKQVKPGETTMGTLHRFSQEYFRKSNLRAKDQAGAEHTMDRFYLHSLGHYLGMDVHDVGDSSKPYQPGEVITIEPGLYVTGEKIGVRIEDDYLVTKDGVEKLTKDIVSDPDEIERLIARARASAEGVPASREAGGGRGGR